MKEIKVAHLGEDYSIVSIDGTEYEASLGLGEALIDALEQGEEIDN